MLRRGLRYETCVVERVRTPVILDHHSVGLLLGVM